MLNSPKTTPIWVGFYLFLASGTEHQTWMWGLPSKITVQLDKPPYIIYINIYIDLDGLLQSFDVFFVCGIYTKQQVDGDITGHEM